MSRRDTWDDDYDDLVISCPECGSPAYLSNGYYNCSYCEWFEEA